MSRISEAFNNGKAFIPFITCGDPNISVTKELIIKMSEAGADIIELGIPFSDPTAEGPTIQNANIRALANDINTNKVFELVKEVRKTIQTPLVFMTYANVVFSYGINKFVLECKRVGIDGIILPDVPFEEKEEFVVECNKEDIDFISLIAPTSKERIKLIAKEAKGFVYCVSSMGVTGTRTNITTNIEEMINEVKSVKDIPCAVGFGISTPKQAVEMTKFADGVIVGSAIVDIIGKYGEKSVPFVEEYVKEMKDAI